MAGSPEIQMKTTTVFGMVLLAGLAYASASQAGERIGDGLLGAGAGAVVGGPVGAVVGGAIGYTAGPHIARRMGIHRHRHQRRALRHDERY